MLNLYNLPLLFSAMVRPKKVETLSVNERAKRWKKKNPQMVKLNKQKQKARELLKSQVSNLLWIINGSFINYVIREMLGVSRNLLGSC